MKNSELEPYEREFLDLIAKGFRLMAEKREHEQKTEACYLEEKNNNCEEKEAESESLQKTKGTLSRAELPNNLTPRNIHQFTNINLRSVYDLMNKSLDHGGIPAFRIGKSLYSDREEFLKWWDETKERGRI